MSVHVSPGKVTGSLGISTKMTNIGLKSELREIELRGSRHGSLYIKNM